MLAGVSWFPICVPGDNRANLTAQNREVHAVVMLLEDECLFQRRVWPLICKGGLRRTSQELKGQKTRLGIVAPGSHTATCRPLGHGLTLAAA
jgi:hypothetical protein